VDRIVIADDHPLFREALARAVARAMPDAEIEQCASLAAAESALARESATLVLLDLKMTDSDGFAGLLALRRAYPATPLVVVSASEEPETIRRALALGAAGFIPKSADLEAMGLALAAILNGETWAPPCGDEVLSAPDHARLTPAQVNILIGLQKGRLNKQIAFDMGVTEATVKAHMTAIFRKLGVQNRTQAVLAAQSIVL
jgi:DNA-binding NarL/FixJ family response regulator